MKDMFGEEIKCKNCGIAIENLETAFSYCWYGRNTFWYCSQKCKNKHRRELKIKTGVWKPKKKKPKKKE